MKSRRANKAKKFSKGCRNHGSCPWCEGNRTYSNKKRAPADWDAEVMRNLREASITIYGD